MNKTWARKTLAGKSRMLKKFCWSRDRSIWPAAPKRLHETLKRSSLVSSLSLSLSHTQTHTRSIFLSSHTLVGFFSCEKDRHCRRLITQCLHAWGNWIKRCKSIVGGGRIWPCQSCSLFLSCCACHRTSCCFHVCRQCCSLLYFWTFRVYLIECSSNIGLSQNGFPKFD